MANRYAVVSGAEVVQVVKWDGVSPWTTNAGEVVACPNGEKVSVGWTYADGVFTNPDTFVLDWDWIRADRDDRLRDCDWTTMPDAPLDDATKQAWATYRQALRDVPQDFSTPDEVVWPTPPA